jgi:hypothetical protein
MYIYTNIYIYIPIVCWKHQDITHKIIKNNKNIHIYSIPQEN